MYKLSVYIDFGHSKDHLYLQIIAFPEFFSEKQIVGCLGTLRYVEFFQKIPKQFLQFMAFHSIKY